MTIARKNVMLMAGGVALSSTLNAGVAQAFNFTTFTDRNAFEAAVNAQLLELETENFNSFAQDQTFTGNSLSVGDLTFSADRLGFIDAPRFAGPQLNIDGTSNISFVVDQNQSADISFDAPIRAFGADFANISEGNRDTRFVFEDGSDLAVPDRGRGGFFGFLFDSPLVSFDLQGFNQRSQNGLDGFSIDNIAYAAAEEVSTPEPASLLGLLTIGTFGAGMLRKRQQAG